MTKKLIALGALAVSLAACSPQQFESAPVTVDSPQGPVTCQLYTKNMLDWDRSTDRPNGMSVTEADNLCRAEGRRQQGGSS
ncbi:hypothetical protein [Paracoccus caeni]|uniref:hypothetical protein n=1 Tax=Paracoccus caeni TaxID=657651 RepID=UPI002D7FB473|nr:hypothetical protein [Paracoccus caeni]